MDKLEFIKSFLENRSKMLWTKAGTNKDGIYNNDSFVSSAEASEIDRSLLLIEKTEKYYDTIRLDIRGNKQIINK